MPVEQKFALTEEHFRMDLQRQLQALAAAVDRFDAGEISSVDDMVLRIWKIIGDRYDAAGNLTKKNHPSLLTWLQEKHGDIVDISFHFDPQTLRHMYGPFVALGILPVGARDHVALLDGFEDHPDFYGGGKTNFLTWWNSPILRDGHGSVFSRRFIVENMRDKEVMHTDDNVPMSYGRLAYRNSVNIRTAKPEIEVTSKNIINVVVRQISHELLRTFIPDYPKKFSIKSGQTAYPVLFVQHHYTTAAGQEARIYDYDAYKYITIWAESEKDAEAYKAHNPVRQQLTSTYINFYAERFQSFVLPTGCRFALGDFFPVEVTISHTQLGHYDGDTIALLAVA